MGLGWVAVGCNELDLVELHGAGLNCSWMDWFALGSTGNRGYGYTCSRLQCKRLLCDGLNFRVLNWL